MGGRVPQAPLSPDHAPGADGKGMGRGGGLSCCPRARADPVVVNMTGLVAPRTAQLWPTSPTVKFALVWFWQALLSEWRPGHPASAAPSRPLFQPSPPPPLDLSLGAEGAEPLGRTLTCRPCCGAAGDDRCAPLPPSAGRRAGGPLSVEWALWLNPTGWPVRASQEAEQSLGAQSGARGRGHSSQHEQTPHAAQAARLCSSYDGWWPSWLLLLPFLGSYLHHACMLRCI